MITCVTPMASRPMIDTRRIISTSRWEFIKKLWSRTIQPNNSNTSPMPISTRKILSSVGSRRRFLTGAVAGLLSVIAFIANHLLILWCGPTAGPHGCSSVDYGHTGGQLHDFSWVASARSRVPISSPSCITITRSLMPSTSGSSEEIMITAMPSLARKEIRR